MKRETFVTMKTLSLLILLGLWIPGACLAQESIQLTAEGPKVMAVGEVARLAYTINAKAEGFTGPKIDGFLFSGPMLSTSMSTQIINSQVSQSVSYTYNYNIQATVEGVFTIPSASAVVKGKTFTSGPVRIEVVKGNQDKQQGAQGGGSSDGVSPDDLFVKIEVDHSQVYKGEQIFATIKIYTRVTLARFGEIKMPAFGGFWNQEIPTSEQVSLERTNYNGRIYNMGMIRKTILVPQKTGKISIEPFEIECFVNVQRKGQRSPFDDFFGNYETVSKRIKSLPVEITVKPFPDNQPAGFNGAVGKFTISAGIDKHEVKTNEAITLKVNVKGNGNIKLIELPAFRFPADLEVYDPKITDNIDAGSNGITGSKTFEYLIIPRHAGAFEIPAWNFSYFDPTAGSFKSFTSDIMRINVTKGENDSEATIVSTPGKEDIRVIGQDIRFIKTGKPNFKVRGDHFFASTGFIFNYIILSLIFIVIILYFRSRFKNLADVEGSRFRKANVISRKRLALARKFLESLSRDEFLEALTKALWGYVSDKFNINFSNLNRDNIRDLLVNRGVDAETIKNFIETIDHAEFLRFAPGTGEGDLHQLLTRSEQVIISIEKTYRR
ncbi:MAG: protein BatD [Porphyromonadaceae bacterium]|nr:MAG: protein BatD [Porphyromonadaceae bacterium]